MTDHPTIYALGQLFGLALFIGFTCLWAALILHYVRKMPEPAALVLGVVVCATFLWATPTVYAWLGGQTAVLFVLWLMKK